MPNEAVHTLTPSELAALFRVRVEVIKALYGENNIFRLAGSKNALLDPGRPKVAILGTRDIRQNDLNIIDSVVSALSKREDKPVIISGLAVGTDTKAHVMAVRCGLPTYAVMPCGLDRMYPFHNTKLAETIEKNDGGLISYFPDGTEPIALNFIERTKAIVLMSDVLIIPCCKRKGTAMLAARYAYDINSPKVFAVPGEPGCVSHEGCNILIKEGIAEIVCNINDFSTMKF